MPDPAAYNWIGSVLGDAACVTVVTGSSVAEVLGEFGADPSKFLVGDDVYGGGSSYPASVAVAAIEGGVVAVEFNGYHGSLSDLLVPLSEDGTAASIYWNVEDDNSFTCARHGRVVATVDMYDARHRDIDLPEQLISLYRLAGVDGADRWAVGLAMVEAFTGVPVPRNVIASMNSSHPITKTKRPESSAGSASAGTTGRLSESSDWAFLVEEVLPPSSVRPGDATIVCRKIARKISRGTPVVGDEIALPLNDDSTGYATVVAFSDATVDKPQSSTISIAGVHPNEIRVGCLIMRR